MTIEKSLDGIVHSLEEIAKAHERTLPEKKYEFSNAVGRIDYIAHLIDIVNDDIFDASIPFHICTSSEYDATTHMPTVSDPDEGTIYMVPSSVTETGNLFDEWVYVDSSWEHVGSTTIDVSALKEEISEHVVDEIIDEVEASIPTTVIGWLNDHVNPESNVVIDDSLSISGAAADAAKVGELKSAIGSSNKIEYKTLSYVLGSDGMYNAADSTKKQVITDRIPVEQGDFITIDITHSETRADIFTAIGLYNGTTWVQRVTLATGSGQYVNGKYVIPSGVTHVRFTYTTYGDAEVVATKSDSMNPFVSEAKDSIVTTENMTEITPDMVAGFLSATGGIDAQNPTFLEYTTDYINVNQGDIVRVHQVLSEFKTEASIVYSKFNDSAFVSRTVLLSLDEQRGSNFDISFEVPSGCDRIRISYRSFGISTVNFYVVRNVNALYERTKDISPLTPYQLGMYPDKGYISDTSSFGLNRSIVKERALFAWLPCGKGTKISVDTKIIKGFSVLKYNIDTGEYIETQGNVVNNLSPITVSTDSCILIYVLTGYSDSGDYYDTINSAIHIQYVEPPIELTEYPSDFEYGTLDGTSGEPSGTSTARLRTKEFLTVGQGTSIYLQNTYAQLNIYYYGMDGSSGFISATGNTRNPVFTVPQDMKIKLLGVAWLNADSFSSVKDMRPKIRFVEPKAEHLPAYYFTDDYITDKAEEINSHNDCAYNGLMFAFITDTHWATNAKRSPLLMKYLSENTEIKDIVFNGDGITNYSTKDLAITNYNDFRSAFSDYDGFHWYPVIGNHELNNPSAVSGASYMLSASEAYGMTIKENERIITRLDEYSYYVDRTDIKVRQIFVGCSYTSQITEDTQTAVISAINSTPEGYRILVCSHVALEGTGATGMVDSSFQPILNALDEVHDKVLCVFSGHRHADGAITTEAGVMVIATTCDALTSLDGATRTRGTTTENAFDVVQIDLNTGKIYMTRIGAGSDREFPAS